MKPILAHTALLAILLATAGCSAEPHEIAIARLQGVGASLSFDSEGRVTSVDLSDTWANDEDLAVICTLPQVQTINCTNASRIRGSSLHQLSGLPNLQTLYLVGTQLDDAGLYQLQHCKGLTTLNLDSTRITDAGMPALDHLDNLQTLVLGKTAITDRGLIALRDLRQLSTLILRDTQTTPQGVNELHHMLPNVRVVR